MSTATKDYEGRCHCGAIGYVLHTARPPAKWTLRSCQCSFCRGHGSKNMADASGSVEFRIADASKLIRYRFASRSLEFLVCSGCGGYIGAVHASPRGQWATLNTNALPPMAELPQSIPFVADDAPLSEKQAGREQRWTPVTAGLGG